MRAIQNIRQKPQNGFTLLELLISITLLGLILVLLFGGLRLSVRSWDAVQRQVDTVNTVRSVESFLRREMNSAHPYRWKSTSMQGMAFRGERDKVSFVTQLPTRIGSGGLYMVSLELQLDGNGRRMVWKYVPLNAGMQDFSALDRQAQEVILVGAELSDIEDIWLSYFGVLGAGQAPIWVERWESDTSLPSLIRIQVRMADGGDSPDFVVAPMLMSELVR